MSENNDTGAIAGAAAAAAVAENVAERAEELAEQAIQTAEQSADAGESTWKLTQELHQQMRDQIAAIESRLDDLAASIAPPPVPVATGPENEPAELVPAESDRPPMLSMEPAETPPARRGFFQIRRNTARIKL